MTCIVSARMSDHPDFVRSCHMASPMITLICMTKTSVAELTVELWIEWLGRALADWDQSHDNFQVLRDGRNKELGLLSNIHTCHNDLLFMYSCIYYFFFCLLVILKFILVINQLFVCVLIFIYLFIYLFIILVIFPNSIFFHNLPVDIYFFTIRTHFINVHFVLLRPGFFSWGDWGVPHPAKILPIPPPSDTCPRFWTKACPPPAKIRPRKFEKFKYISVSNLTNFSAQKYLKNCISCLK